MRRPESSFKQNPLIRPPDGRFSRLAQMEQARCRNVRARRAEQAEEAMSLQAERDALSEVLQSALAQPYYGSKLLQSAAMTPVGRLASHLSNTFL